VQRGLDKKKWGLKDNRMQSNNMAEGRKSIRKEVGERSDIPTRD